METVKLGNIQIYRLAYLLTINLLTQIEAKINL